MNCRCSFPEKSTAMHGGQNEKDDRRPPLQDIINSLRNKNAYAAFSFKISATNNQISFDSTSSGLFFCFSLVFMHGTSVPITVQASHSMYAL